MERLLGREAQALLAALERPSDVGVRANTRKLAPSRLRELLGRGRAGWDLEPIPWCPSGFVATVAGEDPGPNRPGRHPLHHAGAFYLQDPSAMAVAEGAGAQPGEWVADLAAAPGGKATRLVEQVGTGGLLLANDVHPERVLALGQNLERWGADNTVLVRAGVAELADAWGAVFDRVLLDAPCSGEGMFRKSPAARAMWSADAVRACAMRQADLLAHAAAMVAPGGRLVYSTCTFAPEENEAVVADFLRSHAAYEVEAIELPEVGPGRPDWAVGSAPTSLAGAARLWPHRHRGEGHFVARLQRRDAPSGAEHTRKPSGAAERSGEPAPPRRPSASRLDAAPSRGARSRRAGGSRTRTGQPTSELARVERELLDAFFDATLVARPYLDRPVARAGGRVYALPERALPEGALQVPGGSVIRPGLALGTFRTNRFEPSHALAMALDARHVRMRVDLPLDAPELPAYLHGLELAAPGPDGWLLVCVEGLPLGWGRRAHGVVRNLYPKGLRVR